MNNLNNLDEEFSVMWEAGTKDEAKLVGRSDDG